MTPAELLALRSTPDTSERACDRHIDALTLRRVRLGGTLIASLMVAGALVGLFTDPVISAAVFGPRAGAFLAALILARLTRREWARGRGFPLAVALSLTTAIDLEAQIVHTGLALSPYNAGIALLVMATGLFFPLKPRQTAIAAGAVLLTYAGTMIPLVDPADWATATRQAFFVLTAAVVAVTASHFSSRTLRSEFLAQLALREEREITERLLTNVLPQSIVERLKRDRHALADGFPEATILFVDIVGFTRISSNLPPTEIVSLLNDVFSRFDDLADRYGLEKIKTIGDCYMVVGGLPTPREDHADAVADFAIEMLRVVEELRLPDGTSIAVRAGINTGPVVAGVIGHRKFIYDLWGDAVNVASRMESHGEPGAIQVTEATYEKLRHAFELHPRGVIAVKGKGEMATYFLRGRRES